MGRPREFDTEIALDLAVELFWEQGYEATSILELVEYTGVGRQSLYNVYGDKQSLLLAALDRYAEYEEDEIAVLRKRGAGLAEIEEFFAARVKHLTDGEPRRACFLVNSAMELAARDPAVAERVAAYTRTLERAFAKPLRNGIAAGEIDDRTPVPTLARTLTNATFGLAVTAKTGASRRILLGIATATTARLTR